METPELDLVMPKTERVDESGLDALMASLEAEHAEWLAAGNEEIDLG
jgi:hypothetical protein